MPDSRTHRGPHPADSELFAETWRASLRAAVADLGWLLSRGYAEASSLKLVGDRYALRARQRAAVMRCACSEAAKQRRALHQATSIRDAELWIDGFNVLVTLEVALGGGPVFISDDDCLRDVASVHGTYRHVIETPLAIELLAKTLHAEAPRSTRILLDAPVSNSGRLASLLRARLAPLNVEVELCADPDSILKQSSAVVASADAAILDAAQSWFNLARVAVQTHLPEARIVDLSSEAE